MNKKILNKRNSIITIITLLLIINTIPVSANGWHPYLGDYVWHDININGIQDNDEPGIEEVTVNLYFCDDDTFVRTTTTDSTGYYVFLELDPDNYYVEFIPPTGWAFTPQNQGSDDTKDSDADVTTGITDCTSLIHIEHDLTWDAGLFIPCDPATIGDKIWYDTNQNGLQESGESGVAGITINLLNKTNDILETTTTNQNGNYLFQNLKPDEYRIEIITQSDYIISPQDQGTDDIIDSDINPSDRRTILTILECGETDLTWDAGLYLQCDPSSIGDRVWKDLNVNGIQDNGESSIEGVTVNLLDSTNHQLATNLTDSNGFYQFNNLLPGQYKIEFILISNHEFTLQTQETDFTIDSNANRTTGITDIITLSCGENNLTIDAGLYEIGIYTGCTHGFWKNHEENWVKYTPSDTLSSIFTFPTELASLESSTLMEAIGFHGGEDLIAAARILFIQAVAALLNTVNNEVNYPLTETQVITGVNDAMATLNRTIILDYKDLLDDYNNLGCSCCKEKELTTSKNPRSSGKSSPPTDLKSEDPSLNEEPEIEQPLTSNKPNDDKKPPKHQHIQDPVETSSTPSLPVMQDQELPLPPGLEIIALLGLILVAKKRRLLN